MTSLLTPRIFLEAMMVKAFPGVIDGTAEISAADGARAAAELQKMTAADADTDRMAKIVATQNRIIAAFRQLPAPLPAAGAGHGSTAAAPPPAGRRASWRWSRPPRPTDDDFDSGDDDFDEDDDED